MPKKGLNITKRKDGRWEARIIYAYDEHHKAKYRYLYGKTYAEAKAKKDLAQSEILLHKAYVPDNHLKLKDVIGQFLIHKKNVVKGSTLVHYRNLISTHISELNEYRLSDLNSILIDNYSNRLLECGKRNGKGLSIKTVRDVLSLLRSIFKYAVAQKYMTPDILNFSMPRLPVKSISILNISEQMKLENFATKDSDSYKFGIYLTLYTGLRIGELCALKWSDIDLKQSELHVRHTIQRISGSKKGKTEIVISEPKTHTSIRTIPLPPFIVEFLTVQKLKSNHDGYVLTGRNKYIEPSNYYMRYTRWLKKLNMCHYSFHTLRHTFATRCVENGFDAKTLSEILGHTDVKITLNRYVHPSKEIKKHYMNTLKPLGLQSKCQSECASYI